MTVRDERANDELRPVQITRGYTEMTPGSVLIEMGKTRVLCTAAFAADVPPWLDPGSGWVTAEYAMLPGSSPQRVSRSTTGGRTKEIQRLIGRSLRAVVDLGRLPETVVRVDCDVLQADGGTRTAAITGAWVALHDAFTQAVGEGRLVANPLIDQCAAVSMGIVDGAARLDLDYREDVTAAVDFNVVKTGRGGLVEVQGTAEEEPFSRQQLETLLDLADAGVDRLLQLQREAVGT